MHTPHTSTDRRGRIRRSAMMAAIASAVVATVAFAGDMADASPPVTEDEIFLNISLDSDHELWVFWNITRDDFCAWVASGEEGLPPVIELVPTQAHETGTGAVLARIDATRPMELWNLDDPSDLVGPCDDTDGQAGPWATGEIRMSVDNNDAASHSFGATARGLVTDVDDATWQYTFTRQARIGNDGQFYERVNYTTLARRGR